MSLDGALGQVEAVRGGGDIHLVKIVKGEYLAVFGWEALHGFADRGTLIASFQATVDGTRVDRLVDLVKRQRNGRKAAEFGAVEVGGEREQPGGEGGFLPPGCEVAVGAEEGLLRELFGAPTIMAEAVREIDEWRLPAADDAFERACIAGQNAGCVLLVFGGAGGVAVAQPVSLNQCDLNGRIMVAFFIWSGAAADFLKENETEWQPAMSDRVEQ